MNLFARLFGNKNGSAAPAGVPHGFSLVNCSDEQFVEACYRYLLHRNPDSGRVATHLTALRRLTPRLEIVNAFIRSREFQQRMTQPEYAAPGHFFPPIPALEDIQKHRS